MAKLFPVPEELRRLAVAAVADAWAEGCPAADFRPDRQAWLADVCLRRWRSLERRNVSPKDRARQVRDIARGMVEASGVDRQLVGPLIVDYQYLAGKVLAAIDRWQQQRDDPDTPGDHARH